MSEAYADTDDPGYNIAYTVFFFPYAAFEVPCNLILKKLRPSIWLPSRWSIHIP